MTLRQLPFAKIILLRDDIAEVIINESVEMDLDMVDAYHSFLLANLKAPFSLLINKINPYSYTYEAQKKLGTLEEIKAMAVVAYRRSTKTSTEALAAMPRSLAWNLRIHSNREDALEWLIAIHEAPPPDSPNSQ